MRLRIQTFPVNVVFEALASQNIPNPLRFDSTIKMKVENLLVKAKRPAIFAWLGVQCQHCRRIGKYFALEQNGTAIHFDLYSEDDIMLTIDHIQPKSKGGDNSISNLQTLCDPCNNNKRNFPEHLAILLKQCRKAISGYKREKLILKIQKYEKELKSEQFLRKAPLQVIERIRAEYPILKELLANNFS